MRSSNETNLGYLVRSKGQPGQPENLTPKKKKKKKGQQTPLKIKNKTRKEKVMARSVQPREGPGPW